MGGRGFEPPRVAPIAPKAIAYANSATRPHWLMANIRCFTQFNEPPAARTRHNHLKRVVLYQMS